MMVRTKEGGSVLGFVVIGVVLVGMLVGGAYFLSREPNELAGGNNGELQDPAPAPGDEPSEEESNNAGSDDEQGTDEQAPAEEDQPDAQPESDAPNDDEEQLLGVPLQE